MLNAVLSRAVLEQGLCYPPDPSSWELSTIGGNLATNAGGLCCVKYGVTTDFVRALEVVTASGEILRTGRRTAKGVAGYDLTRLIVGSEGTLGVITQATLGLKPAPEAALTMAAAFATAADALTAVTKIMAAGLQPSMCEFLDGVTVRAIQDYRDMGLPTGRRGPAAHAVRPRPARRRRRRGDGRDLQRAGRPRRGRGLRRHRVGDADGGPPYRPLRGGEARLHPHRRRRRAALAARGVARRDHRDRRRSTA